MELKLYKAATQGDVQALKEVIKKEPKLINSVTPQENTLLHIAARHGHTEFAEELLKSSDTFLPNLKNAEEDTALHIAARNGHLEIVALLIDHALAWPIDIEMGEEGTLRLTNKLQNTALHEAAMNGHSRIALKLMEAELSASHMLNAKKETPLHIAAREGLIQVVSEMLQHPWVPPQEKEEELPPLGTGSPLHQAVLGGHCDILELLLQKRRDFIKVIDKEGNTALHYAARENKPKMVEKLLKSEPSLAYRKNDQGYSSLHIAAGQDSYYSIKKLLELCPDAAEQVDSQGRNALHIAVLCRRVLALLMCLREIIHLDDIINQADDQGNTPLHLAVKDKGINLTTFLLEDKRVNPFIVNKDGHTPRGVFESLEEMNPYLEMRIWNLLYRSEVQMQYRSEDRIRKKHPQLTPFVVDPPFENKSSASTDKPIDDNFKSSAETCTLVAALIATVTFAAFFTMPGGYDNNTGYPLLQSQAAFKVFLISNTIAMCTSLIVVLFFIWAWMFRFKVGQMKWGYDLLVIAFAAMLVALMSAVYVVVAKHCMWLAIVVCFICCSPSALVFFIDIDFIEEMRIVGGMSGATVGVIRAVTQSGPALALGGRTPWARRTRLGPGGPDWGRPWPWPWAAGHHGPGGPSNFFLFKYINNFVLKLELQPPRTRRNPKFFLFKYIHNFVLKLELVFTIVLFFQKTIVV